jgi:hypothetical protein
LRNRDQRVEQEVRSAGGATSEVRAAVDVIAFDVVSLSIEAVEFSGSEDFVATDGWDTVCAVRAETRSAAALPFLWAVGADVFGVASVDESVSSDGAAVGEVAGLSVSDGSSLPPFGDGSSVSVAEGDGLASGA